LKWYQDASEKVGGKVLPFQRDVPTPVVSLNMRLKKWQIALGKGELEILTFA